MRKLLVFALCLVASGALVAQDPAPQTPAPPSNQDGPPQEPPPTFRAGVELLTVDVSATDARGRPIEDLRAPEFSVKIDGEERRVVSADLVRIDVEAARRQAADPFDPLFTSNQTPPNGRLFMIAVDQLHIRPGGVRQVLQAASRFLDRLSPLDRVAFAAFPAPGPIVDFTSDFARIKRVMETVTGNQYRFQSRFNIGLSEAIAIAQRRDFRILEIVVIRECRATSQLQREECEREVLQESELMVKRLREDTGFSLDALRDLLVYLAEFEGSKTMVLISEGMILDTPNDLNDVVRVASLGRIAINALLLDVPFADASVGVRPPTGKEDRQLEVSGLEDLAAYTRGVRYNVLGTGDNIFDRILTSSSAHYLLGVEQAPGDRDGERHRIDVEVRRQGVTLHSRRAFVLSSATGSRRSMEDNLNDALRSPFSVAELPLRGTTFVTQDPASDKVRLMLALEVGQPGTQPEEFMLGYALIDRDGTVISSYGEKRVLNPADGRPSAPLEYLSSVILDPGIYNLRVAAVDASGRRGSLVHTVNAWQMAGEAFAFGDLFVGNMPDSGPVVKPGVEPHVDAGVVAAFMELYTTDGGSLADVTVTFEIAEGQDSPALVTATAEQQPGARPSWRMAQAAIDAAALPPGRYVTRARISKGGEPAGVLVRPLVLGAIRPGAPARVAGPVNLGEIAKFDRQDVLAPEMLASLFDTVARRGDSLAGAVTEARAGRYGAAALEALTAGDQEAASFLRGLDFYAKGQLDQAATQFNLAAGPRREFFPAGFLLGAAYAEAGRDADAAGVWQMALGSEPRPSAAYALFADARFRQGQPQSVVDVLEPVYAKTSGDPSLALRLGMAYTVLGRYADAVPVLDAYLTRFATDQDALFVAIFANHERHTRDGSTPSAEQRARLARYGAAYKGPQTALATRYLRALDVR